MTSIPSRLARLRHIVFDMDGTIYLGNRLFKTTLPHLALLRQLDIGYSFVTNNCSRSRAEYLAHLREMGIEAPAESMVVSTHATIHYLQQHLPHVRRLFTLNSPGADDDLRLAGFEIVDEAPQAVVVGWDRRFTYDRLCRTAWHIKQGLPYLATHPDRICPTNEATVLPDCGAICALLETATGRRPDAVAGKPSPAMLQEVMHRHILAADEVAMIGDRLYTDVRMARDAGVLAVLTLTGEASAVEAASLPAAERPDLIVEDLDELSAQLVAARGN
ncbi:MAG: HAD-IIA family hydrolase [Pirellulales bacterium]|nr:HAD-IIA family hydrolase [Pirellulales bacterium]